MAFHLTHRYGSMSTGDEASDLSGLLGELDERPEDTEHGSVSVTHESEWCISASRGGYVVFENLESGGERHMDGVPATKVLELWRALARGDIAILESEPWKSGY
ncbi:hypothetical protein AVXHC19_38200 [Acidovorax sacchari]